jgi:hypothetical protein
MHMLKRIGGVIVMIGGLLLTVLCAVALAYDIPANFTVSGKGMDALVNLITKYDLRLHVLLISLGIALVLSGMLLFLSPRKCRVAARLAVTDLDEAAVAPADGMSAESAAEEETAESPRSETAICILRTHLMGTTFRSAGGDDRQALLAKAEAGDILLCRAVPGHQFAETIGVYTVSGALLGYLDTAFTRDIRDRYPNHRIGLTVEEILGGQGVPYRCLLRVGVYRV